MVGLLRNNRCVGDYDRWSLVRDWVIGGCERFANVLVH
jgi:hypothetical protein